VQACTFISANRLTLMFQKTNGRHIVIFSRLTQCCWLWLWKVLNYGIGGHYEPHYDFSQVTSIITSLALLAALLTTDLFSASRSHSYAYFHIHVWVLCNFFHFFFWEWHILVHCWCIMPATAGFKATEYRWNTHCEGVQLLND